jgi:hypothetical protein
MSLTCISGSDGAQYKWESAGAHIWDEVNSCDNSWCRRLFSILIICAEHGYAVGMVVILSFPKYPLR